MEEIGLSLNAVLHSFHSAFNEISAATIYLDIQLPVTLIEWDG